MKIGFWNIQRATNPDSLRTQIMGDVLLNWLNDHKPSVVVLCEVTQTGKELEGEINPILFKYGYIAKYIEVPGVKNKDKVSPCSFMVVRQLDLSDWAEPKAVGATTRRPYIRMRVDGIAIGACHAIAIPSMALEEAQVFADDVLGGKEEQAILIGDMNSDFNEKTEFDDYLFQLKLSRYQPGLKHTHLNQTEKKAAILDYAWATNGLKLTACPIDKGYDDLNYIGWADIDHAPIQYDVS